MLLSESIIALGLALCTEDQCTQAFFGHPPHEWADVCVGHKTLASKLIQNGHVKSMIAVRDEIISEVIDGLVEQGVINGR